MKRFLGIFVLTLVLALLWVGVASAQQPTPSDDEVNAIASQLFCPVCQNTPLDVCPTQACHDWRELIRQMLAEGKSADQIKQYFVDHYGARVLSEPPRTGFNWLIYVVPPLAFLIGVYLLFRAYRMWRRPPVDRAAPVETAPDLVSDEKYVSRLEEELRKRK
jgi:cytochrome c-type biogenesis protein CcmH